MTGPDNSQVVRTERVPGSDRVLGGNHGLGRHIEHDERSRAYRVVPRRLNTLRSVRWARRCGVLDQGTLGSCTGNAAVGLLGTDSIVGGTLRRGLTSVALPGVGNEVTAGIYPVDEELAKRVYTVATRLDAFPGEWPPEDTGSSGNGAAKAMRALGLATGWHHAFSVDALDTALQSGPVMIGIPWYNSMFNPDMSRDGRLTVDPTSGLAGGHEIVVDGVDMNGHVYHLTNSWGTGWGKEGGCYIGQFDMQLLLRADGDATALTWPVPAKPRPPRPRPWWWDIIHRWYSKVWKG